MDGDLKCLQSGSLWLDIELDGVHIRVERVTKYTMRMILRELCGWNEYKTTRQGKVLRWDSNLQKFSTVGEHGTC